MINQFTSSSRVAIFSKTTCPFCARVKNLFESNKIQYQSMELDQLSSEEMAEVQDHLMKETGIRTVPNVWMNGSFAGDSSKMQKLLEDKMLFKTVEGHDYDYDLIVIGGGSGGLSASKRAASLGRKVAVLDFVQPSPVGTQWGLGGTCVNVGCIPKKLMHQAAIHGHNIEDAEKFGWQVPAGTKNNWSDLVSNTMSYVGGINWGYRVELRDTKVNYLNAFGSFVDKNTIKCIDKKKKETNITGKDILIAVGERPTYPPEIPPEYVITSDDLFRLNYNPGKTLIIGASYIALECAGFLHGIGNDVTIMVRSIFLRGFDQQMADIIGDDLEESGVKMLKKDTVQSIEQIKAPEDENPGLYKVTSNNGHVDEYNTILYAIGRKADLSKINIDAVNLNHEKNKIIVDDYEKTNIDNIYCLGDVAKNRPELTPAAIQGGSNLANRLYGSYTSKTDYINIPTTVFTPMEYSCCGLSEEQAEEQLGKDNILTFHKLFTPLENAMTGRRENKCYIKVIVEQSTDIIKGIHYAGPNAGEVMQGFAAAMKMGLTKNVLDTTVGIHPTTAEWITSLEVTKQSGEVLSTKGC